VGVRLYLGWCNTCMCCYGALWAMGALVRFIYGYVWLCGQSTNVVYTYPYGLLAASVQQYCCTYYCII